MTVTSKQKKAFSRIMENHGNVSKSMIEVGYAPNTAKNPKNLTDSDGFQELLNESGLTDKFLTDALYKDIKNKPSNRVPEMNLAFKLKRKLEDDEKGNTYNQFNFFDPEQFKRSARRILDDERTSEKGLDRIHDSNQSEI